MNLNNEQGNAFIELAFCLPIVLFVVFASLEAASALRYHEVTFTLSRELASTAFRTCAVDSAAYGSSKFNPQTCIEQEVRPGFRRRVDKVLPNAEFIVSVYTYESSTSSIQSAQAADRAPQSSFVSRHSAASMAGEIAKESELGKSLKKYGTLVVAEVSLPHPGLSIPLPQRLKVQLEGVYAATII